jgi:hypothetical protein
MRWLNSREYPARLRTWVDGEELDIYEWSMVHDHMTKTDELRITTRGPKNLEQVMSLWQGQEIEVRK